jgi:hypothetical protein
MRYLNSSVHALANPRDTWRYRIHNQSLVRHRLVRTHTAIPKEGCKITASTIFDIAYEHKTNITMRLSAARRTMARNAFIVTADVKSRTSDRLTLTQFIHKFYGNLIKKSNA